MAIHRASEFFRTHDEGVLLNELKTYSLSGRSDLLQEAIDRFREQADIAIEVRDRSTNTHANVTLFS
jgi:hypothetical protein